MGIALQKLAKEDPSFRVHTDEESGQTIISGMGELHLDIIVDRMKREFKVEANVGKPQVAYRETIRKTVEQEGKFVRQSGGRGQYGHVYLRSNRCEPVQGTSSSTRSLAVWCQESIFRPSIRGVQEQMENGVLRAIRWWIARLRCTTARTMMLTRARWRLRSPARWASGRAQRANPVLLEPIMKVEVVTPEDYMGDVMGDLNRRRGLPQGMDDTPSGKTIRAEVPLAEMFGYATDLRSMSQGRAVYSMEFEKYREVPQNVCGYRS